MKIYVLIPVFNRLDYTKAVLICLRAQTFYKFLKIIVINDGSTDGTMQYLSSCDDVSIISGDGNLWWAGAMQKGLDFVSKSWQDADFLLFLNNDIIFENDYIECLVNQSLALRGASVGSIVCEQGDGFLKAVSIGPIFNMKNYELIDALVKVGSTRLENLMPYYEVDALSGRGVLYPVVAAKKTYGFRAKFLPHYLADYEYACRIRGSGAQLVVSTSAIVISPPIYGNDISKMGFWQRKFGKRSAENCIRTMIFYMLIGGLSQKIRAPFFITFFTCRDFFAYYFPALRRGGA
jgi:GT2 family glycosyltransferase